MTPIIDDIRKELRKNADAKTRDSGKRFFREAVTLYGVKTATVSIIGNEYFKKIRDLGKAEIFRLCVELLKSGYMEEAFIAYEWSYAVRKEYVASDFSVFERWLETYVSNWAECDTLCNHTIGTVVEMFPEYLPRLMEWTKSPNRWVRRAAAVTLILPARNGKFLQEVFRIADSLLTDSDDLVQKGYGWLLKEASKPYQAEVYAYIINNKKDMPRTALRYAIEKMPPDLRAKAMEKI